MKTENTAMVRLRWEVKDVAELFELVKEHGVRLRWVKDDGVYLMVDGLEKTNGEAKAYALDLGPPGQHENPTYQREVIEEIVGDRDFDGHLVCDKQLLEQYRRAVRVGVPYFYIDIGERRHTAGFTR